MTNLPLVPCVLHHFIHAREGRTLLRDTNVPNESLLGSDTTQTQIKKMTRTM